ncbi:hypothetical protein [Brevibacillus formosus]|uniref:hypothetical protein n=1 Tax=Brevibacillus formosus TaxID=54913 RepID=UPI003F1B6D18
MIKLADKQTIEALKVLQAEAVIQSPEYWIQNAYEGGFVHGEFAALLIQNMAKRMTTNVRQPEISKPAEPNSESVKTSNQPKLWSEKGNLTKGDSIHMDAGPSGTAEMYSDKDNAEPPTSIAEKYPQHFS